MGTVSQNWSSTRVGAGPRSLLFSEEGKGGVDMGETSGRRERLERGKGGKLCSVVI